MARQTTQQPAPQNQQAVQNLGQQSKPLTPLQVISNKLNGDTLKQKFTQMLGTRAPQFISSVLSVVSNNKLLSTAEFDSIYGAAVMAATLDLAINQNLGFAYIIPYENKREGKVYAQFQMGYRGFIQLAMRSSQFKTINVTEVRNGEIANEDLLTGEITFNWLPRDKRPEAPVVGYAAYFRLINGFEKTFYMSIAEAKKHAETYSKTYQNDLKYKSQSSKWSTDFDAMAKKTVLKLLLAKYAPLSVQMQQAEAFDQGVVSKSYDDVTDVDFTEVKYVDNDNTPEPPVSQAPADINERAQAIANAAQTKAAAAAATAANEAAGTQTTLNLQS